MTPDIIFPHLGIEFQEINSVAFSVFGFDINWYGICVAFGIFFGSAYALAVSRKNGIDPDKFLDLLLIAVPICIVCTRLYFVIFSWDYYKNDLTKIFAFRDGGMGVYGGIIAAFLTVIVYCRVRKISIGKILDIGVPGLALGQVIGRFGNFFNQEAFGEYTDSLLAMRLKLSNVPYSVVTQKMYDNLITAPGGISYIQVHPTFLYEILWNSVLVAVFSVYRKHKKFDGEIGVFYLIGYGIGRFFIEGLRTDQLMIGSTGIPVSQVVSILITALGAVLLVIMLRRRGRAVI